MKTFEKDLLTTPTIYGNVQRTIDKRETSNVGSQGDKTTADMLQAGVMGQSSFGLSSKLYYTVNRYDIEGSSPSFLAKPKYFTAAPTVRAQSVIMAQRWRT